MSDGPANPLQVSDEDFLNMPPPEPSGAEAKEPTAEEIAAHNAGDPVVEEPAVAPEKVEPEAKPEPTNPLAEPDDKKVDPPAAVDPNAVKEPDPKAPEAGADPLGSKKEGDVAEPDAGSGKTFSVPVTFRANGKDIELKSEAEALALMQMGANYTKRMQELQPHRKMLMMLQNNQLDEGTLNFLIDVKNGDKEALKKLMKDSGVDPLDLDANEESTYVPGSHIVTDDEAGFRTVLDEITSSATGNETLAEINTRWDSASKEVAFKQPEIMKVIHEQRENGIYATIVTEVDRRITLGQIPANVPFLQAYKTVGDELANAAIAAAKDAGEPDAGGGAAPIVAPEAAKVLAEPIATRAAAPKPVLANGDKAAAASPTKSTPAGAKVAVNALAQSDDDFMKQFEGRL